MRVSLSASLVSGSHGGGWSQESERKKPIGMLERKWKGRLKELRRGEKDIPWQCEGRREIKGRDRQEEGTR